MVGIPELGSRDGKSFEAKLLLFLVCSSAALGIRRRVAMMSEGVVQEYIIYIMQFAPMLVCVYMI